MSHKEDNLRIDTKLVHTGDPEPRVLGAVSMPIFQSANYEYVPAGSYRDISYIRMNNTPNHKALHAKLSALENAESALVTASGMAAITTSLLTVLRNGDHLLAQDSLSALNNRMRARRRIHIRTTAPLDQGTQVLANLDGVVAVNQPEPTLLIVDAAEGQDPRADLARVVVQTGVGLLELSEERLDIEAVFLQLIEQARKESSKAATAQQIPEENT